MIGGHEADLAHVKLCHNHKKLSRMTGWLPFNSEGGHQVALEIAKRYILHATAIDFF